MKLLLVFLISSLSIMSWTMNNWLMIWYLMDICLILFMGICGSSGGYSTSESMMKYYLIQVSFSLIMLVFMFFYILNLGFLFSIVLMVGLLVKMGMFPFHFWLVLICGKLEWTSFYVLSTLMKLIPLMLLYYLFSISSFFFVVASSTVFGGLMGLNSGVIQKMIVYSSMVNICWFLYSLSISLILFWFYFTSYICMLGWLMNLLSKHKIFYINQFSFNHISLASKVMMLIYSLSIAGFPPFLGFMIKWMVINYLWYFGLKILISLMILFSLLAVYYYLQMFFFIMVVFSSWMKWYTINLTKFGWLSFMFLMSYLGLFLFY
uniref:NADH-ubiquinone oxidoreductase chain 2 n=1 Tax=Bemisia sp. WTT-2017 TaxID=1974374 RepID=A0A1W6CGF5_9HEMI|nr:NADH dehydrogenase subunit 2 [Bemisia sp. WTT-2017]